MTEPSDYQLLSWPCPRCLTRNWAHYEHCQSCGLPRPKAEVPAADPPIADQDGPLPTD